MDEETGHTRRLWQIIPCSRWRVLVCTFGSFDVQTSERRVREIPAFPCHSLHHSD